MRYGVQHISHSVYISATSIHNLALPLPFLISLSIHIYDMRNTCLFGLHVCSFVRLWVSIKHCGPTTLVLTSSGMMLANKLAVHLVSVPSTILAVQLLFTGLTVRPLFPENPFHENTLQGLVGGRGYTHIKTKNPPLYALA